MRTRTKGIGIEESGSRVVDKQYHRRRIYARLGDVSQDAAEIWLRQEQRRIDVEVKGRDQRLFCHGAERYLLECERRKVKTADLIAYHVSLLLPYIGMKPLELVHNASFESFKTERQDEDNASPTTVNRTLEVARTILNRAARVWRDDAGKPWLSTAPLIEMLTENRRAPRPLSWAEQALLMAELPPHLIRMALFAVNTGLRDENICGLRWKWERFIPELKRSVFVVPAEEYKNGRPHVVILNDVAHNVMESCRGMHKDFVFTYQQEVKSKHLQQHSPDRIHTINNSAYQKARARASLDHVRVHDLRHTYAQRLRDAGVAGEDRAVLMGHAVKDMTEHYATPTIARLVEMANLVQSTRDTPTLLRIVNG
jgi:integrase